MGTLRISSRPPFVNFAIALSLGLSCACASGPATPDAAAPASPAPSEPADAEPGTDVAPEASPDGAGSSASPTAEAPPKPPEPSFVELCNKMCDRVTKKCSENAAEACRMNCTQYEHPPAGCDPQVRLALECAAKAEDLTCVNIAPESCAPDFRRVVACASGKPEGAMPEDPTKIPEGWQRFESSSHRFSAPMPPGVTEKGSAPPTFAVSSGGATYQVRVMDPPKDPPTQKNLVKVGMALVGKCQKNLKLFSMVERPGSVTIRFQSGCPNGEEISGFIAITSGKMYVLEVQGPKDAKAPKDPFFYNFEAR